MFQFQRHRKQRSLLWDPGSRESRPGVIQKQRSAGGVAAEPRGRDLLGTGPGGRWPSGAWACDGQGAR